MVRWLKFLFGLALLLTCSVGTCLSRVNVEIVFSSEFGEIAPFSREEARRLVLERLKQHGNVAIVSEKVNASDFVYVSFDVGADKSQFVICVFSMQRAGLRSVLSGCADISEECFSSADAKAGQLGIGWLKYGPLAFTGSIESYEETVKGVGMVLCYFFEP